MSREIVYNTIMNFLGHAILSDASDDALFASTMGDYIRGDTETLPQGIQDGLHIHSGIDTFYDTCPLLTESRTVLWNVMKGYENLAIDICGDYAIARHWKTLFVGSLEDFESEVERIIEPRLHYLTPQGQHIAQRLIRERWLASYAQVDGLVASLNRMADRAKRGHLIRDNIPVVLDLLPSLEAQVLATLPDIRQHTLGHMRQLGYTPELRVQWREGNSFKEALHRGGERR